MTTDPPGAVRDGRFVGVGLRRFDPLLNGIVGVFGVLYTLQTADSLAADLPSMSYPLGTVVIALVMLSVLAGIGPIVLPSRARAAFIAGIVLYVAAVVLWPLSLERTIPSNPMPWLVAVWPVPAAYLALATRRRVLPIALATVHSATSSVALQTFGGVDTADTLVDFLFMTGTSVVLVLLLGAVRRGVVVAAQAQQAALDRFAAVRIDEATEAERKRTDALMHDAVLTTFLAASAARTPEAEDLARRMAANSLRVLMHVNGLGRDGSPVRPFGQSIAEERERLDPLLAHFDADFASVEEVMLPEEVSRVVVSVLVEVVRNSVQHAHGATRRVLRAAPLGPDGIRVTIEDDGCGADIQAIRARGGGEGVLVANRLRALDGRVDVQTAPGKGVRVVVSWGSVVMAGTDLLSDDELTVTS